MTAVYNLMNSHLEVEIGEDPMEIASDFDHETIMEEDIDIELDLDDGEDEKMSEDAKSLRDEDAVVNHELYPGNDDEMVDEGQTPRPENDIVLADDEELVDAEEELLDLSPNARQNTIDNDEDLNQGLNSDEYNLVQTSYGIDEVSNIYENIEPQTSATFAQDTDINRQSIGIANTNIIDEDAPDSTNIEFGSDNGIEDTLADEEENETDDKEDYGASQNPLEDHKKELSTTQFGVSEANLREVSNPRRINLGGSPTADVFPSLPKLDEGNFDDQPNASGYIPISEPQPDDVPHQSTNSYESMSVHPVIVLYQKNEISLFPPDEQGIDQTYFLKDQSLASESISDLLGACKLVLADSIGEQDELEIRIESLGLEFCETTAESSTTSLAQVLELYLQLQQNDGVDDPNPLYMTLITKVKISQRLEQLHIAVAEGKGFTQVAQFIDFDETDTVDDATGDPSRPNSEDAITDNVAETVTGNLESEQDTDHNTGSNIYQTRDDLAANNREDDDQNPIKTLGEDEVVDRENEFADHNSPESNNLHETRSVEQQLQGSRQPDGKGQDEPRQHEASHDEDYFEEDDEHQHSSSEFGSYPKDEQSVDQIAEQSLKVKNRLGKTNEEASLDVQPAGYTKTDRIENQIRINYEEDQRQQGSSTASSTLRGDESEVAADPEEGRSANVTDESHELFTTPTGQKAVVNHRITSYDTGKDVGSNDEGDLGEVTNGNSHENDTNVLDINNEIRKAVFVDNLLLLEDDPDATVRNISRLHSNDDSAYDDDNDEITYSDEEEEELNKDTSQHQNLANNKDNSAASLPNKPSVKRIRADFEDGAFTKDELTDPKRIRSD